ncbi:MAG: 50S ribosomal protein L21 [Bacteroidales bacterium]|nr:50S ribosomal protein L21 [Bacteroidales bacterium]
MYAIVEISGQQFRVEKNQEIFVHRQKGDPGSNVEYNQVLVLEKEGNVTVGRPLISDAVVQAKIVGHLRGNKVIVFKKKRRKTYQVQNGHRQYLSKILIEDILTEAPPKAEKKAQKPEKEAKKEKATEVKPEIPAAESPVKPAAEKKADTPETGEKENN